MIELTHFTKTGGPLTKRISLGADGSLCSDASQCVMSRGTARRVHLPDLLSVGRLLDHMTPQQALGLGSLRADLPDGWRSLRRPAERREPLDRAHQ
jgi:hypothetical protein